MAEGIPGPEAPTPLASQPKAETRVISGEESPTRPDVIPPPKWVQRLANMLDPNVDGSLINHVTKFFDNVQHSVIPGLWAMNGFHKKRLFSEIERNLNGENSGAQPLEQPIDSEDDENPTLQ